jgi:uncharacterized protein YqgC (DUF456 family)
MLEPWLYYLLAVVFVLICGGAWLTNLFTLPGNWFMLGLAAPVAWLVPEETSGRGMTWAVVFWLVGLAIVGEVVEFAAGAAGAAKRGASRRSVLLAIIGALVGSIGGVIVGVPIPLIGSLIGAILGGALGAFAGAYIGEAWKGRDEDQRVAAGRGAFAGRIWGTVAKLAIGAIMLVIIAWDAFL